MLMPAAEEPLSHLARWGYALLASACDGEQLLSLAARLPDKLAAAGDRSVLQSRGQTYGARDLLRTFPEITRLLGAQRLRSFVGETLGPGAGIVRVLFFDKPPGVSWSLPWHQDRTIAVQRNDLPTVQFSKPTFKAGVPHVEAPVWLLENMLTLRVHVDAMTAENGPLSVIPGSHRSGALDGDAVELYADVGDVLAMRPLLSHSSSMSRDGTTMHRRVIHFELAAHEALPDGYQWYSFIPVAD